MSQPKPFTPLEPEPIPDKPDHYSDYDDDEEE